LLMRKSTIERIESLGLSANSILINFSSGYSLLPITTGTAQSLRYCCHTESCRVLHRAFRFYPAAIEQKKSAQLSPALC